MKKIVDVWRAFGRDTPELSLTEVARRLRRPVSSMSRMLVQMHRAGLLDRNPNTGLYRLGTLLIELGSLAQVSNTLQTRYRPLLEQLVRSTEESASLAVLSGSEGVDIDVIDSPHSVKYVDWVGRRFPLHATAAGKVLLAWRSVDEVIEILGRTLPAFTERTLTDRRKLLRELDRVRARGYATNWAEWTSDSAAVGAPIRDHTETVVAAIVVSMPTFRITRTALAELGESLAQAARKWSTRA